MLRVRSLVDIPRDYKRVKKNLANQCRFVVHRIDFSEDDGGNGYWRDVKPVPCAFLTGETVIQRFADKRRVKPLEKDWRDRPGRYTSGKTPYTFLGKWNGGADQLLPLSEYGPHAMRWSWSGVAYAVAGDFRYEKDEPTKEQWADLVETAAIFCAWFQQPPTECLFGHTELPGGSTNPDKECPGPNLDMHRLRWEVEGHPLAPETKERAELRLRAMGVVF